MIQMKKIAMHKQYICKASISFEASVCMCVGWNVNWSSVVVETNLAPFAIFSLALLGKIFEWDIFANYLQLKLLEHISSNRSVLAIRS